MSATIETLALVGVRERLEAARKGRGRTVWSPQQPI